MTPVGDNRPNKTRAAKTDDLTCWEVLGNKGSLGLMSFPAEPCTPLSPLVIAERLCVRRQLYCVREAVMKRVWLWLLLCERVACHWVVRVRGWNWMWLWLRVCAWDVWVTAPEAGSSSCSSVTTLLLSEAIHMLLCYMEWSQEGRAESGSATLTREQKHTCSYLQIFTATTQHKNVGHKHIWMCEADSCGCFWTRINGTVQDKARVKM